MIPWMSDTYSAVDDAADVHEALVWQDRVDGWPQVRAYKARSYQLLEGRSPVLDVGAGTGNDVVALGVGAVGTDLSAAMCQEARRRGAVVCRGDAVHLPFAGESFGAVRADRVLQHLAEPTDAIREMVRVTRRGGRVVVCDPDQESLVISVPGVSQDLADAVKQLRRDRGYRNGTLAARLPVAFGELGLGEITVDAFPLVLRDPDDAFGLPGWVRYWGHAHPPAADIADVGDRGFTAEDVQAWERGMELARRDGQLVYALLYFVVSGRRS